jgi:hypothetical protein
VTISDGAGPGHWWGNAGSITPLSSADISIGGLAAVDVSASVSAAAYSYSPPSPFTAPMLGGTFVVPPGAGLGVQDVVVTEPNTTGLPGTVSASVPLTTVGTGCSPSQTVNFTSGAPSGAVFNGPTYSVTASATSDLPVALTVDASTSAVCSITGGTVSFIGAGPCTIDANQFGDDQYLAAPQVQQSFLVDRATPSIPTITNIPAPGVAMSGGNFVPMVSTSGDGVTSVTSSTPLVCTIGLSDTALFQGTGLCTLTAHVAAGADYAAADGTSQGFTVGPEVQEITSPNQASATSHSDFSFTVTTIGVSTPIITEKGKLPKHVHFTNEGNGTASIAGTPVVKKTKTYHLTITATFYSGTTTYKAVQAFTLTVNPA